MNDTSNWLVTTYEYEPDMWNTKPPLMIWLQVMSIKLVGDGELAIRLPSAFAALATCFLLFWFFVRKQKNPLLGFLTCIVLITSDGYVRRHGIRTGDYDSVLTFFITSFVLSWYMYIEEDKLKYFYSFLCALILACLTKGVQPLIFLPALLLYTAYRRSVLMVLKSPHFYLGILIFLLCVGGYYFLREQYNPGYINAVLANEVGGRFGQVIEQHEGDSWYYFELIFRKDFSLWCIPALLGLLIGIAGKDRSVRYLSIYLGIAATLYLIILSSAATKIHWYDTPSLPILSVLSAISLYWIFTKLTPDSSKYRTLYIVVALGTIALPYTFICKKVMGDEEHIVGYEEHMHVCRMLQRAARGKEDIKGYYVTHGHLEQNVLWYTELLVGKKIIKTRSKHHLDPGTKVIAFQPDQQQYIAENYIADTIAIDGNIVKYYIKERK